ncbi:protein MANBAL-like [Hyalella azteca]|uniref:Protein MANBAL-like n=1 Tax=Hyalella azteca TaxID=294128 RepID=A0A979FGQ9_HYAAZ|nr:protein MANBAL-like [Hyalella azteca]
MAIVDPSLTETTLMDEVLKYGLFLGAIFQMMCIAAVVFVPSKNEKREGDSSDDDGSEHGSPHTPHRSHPSHQSHHRRKHDKKKRR